MKKRMNRGIAILLTACMAAAALAGCGSGSSSSSSAAADSSAEGETAAAASGDVETLTLDAIKKKGKLVVATEAAYEPFEYLDADGTTVIGYNADLFHQICDDLGVELVYQDLPFQGILAGLEAGQYDMVGATLGITAERAAKYTMTEPIQKGTNCLVKRADDDSIQTIDDMNGKIVGTQTSAYNEDDTREYDKKLKAEGKEGFAEIKTYASYADAYNDLRNGQIDAVAQNYASQAAMVKNHPDTYAFVNDSDGNVAFVASGDVWVGWAVRKSDTELSDYINSEIEKFKENGFLAKEQEKWFGTTTDLPSDNYIPAE